MYEFACMVTLLHALTPLFMTSSRLSHGATAPACASQLSPCSWKPQGGVRRLRPCMRMQVEEVQVHVGN